MMSNQFYVPAVLSQYALGMRLIGPQTELETVMTRKVSAPARNRSPIRHVVFSL
jgi:hypothetical protein